MTVLVMWTVYDHPKDYPNHFVARKWLTGEVLEPTDEILINTNLDVLRQQLPPWLYCMPRHPDDDPKIIETWL